MDLRVLNGAEVRQALPMAAAIAGMKAAYLQLSAGKATVPLRTQVGVPEHEGTAIFMPAYLPQNDALAVKVVSVFPQNLAQGIPTIHGVVLVLDAATGRAQALLEGGVLTAIRTGAGSGAATDVLARPGAETVAIIGSGVQARTQLEAVCTVRAVRDVRVYSPTYAHARAFAQEMAGNGPIPDAITVADTPAGAVRGADIVCTATTASTPVFDGHDLAPGAHVNAVGSFTTQMQEVDVTTIRRARVVVDSRAAVMEEAGDLVIPIQAGEIDESHIFADLGEILAGQKPGREHPTQLTYFKSVGIAVQDTIAASIALQNAAARNLGTVISL